MLGISSGILDRENSCQRNPKVRNESQGEDISWKDTAQFVGLKDVRGSIDMAKVRHKLHNRTWKEITDPIFLKCRQMFSKTVERQARKYANLMRKGNIKGKSRTLIAVASVYASAKQSDYYKMSMHNIAKEFKVADVSVRRYFNYLVKLVEGK